MNKMKKKMKIKEKIEEKEDLRFTKLQKEEDMLMKMFIEEMSATHTY